MDASAQLPALPEQPEPAAELHIVNGRLGGARRALSGPLTLIGQGTGCDLRLNEDGVALLHCAIFRDPGGAPVLRDLETPNGTRVNGKPVTTCRLANGDRVEVGSVVIEVALETPPTAEQPAADLLLAERDRESLRIQAAAVVAQQAALDEVETRLDQHRVALERQETQLSSHLDARNQRLDESEKSLEHDRAALRSEREEVAREKADLAAQQQHFAAQRQKLQELRRQLTERYKKAARQQEAALARREAEASATAEKARRERATVAAFQERVNGELELGRQQLREQRRLLDEARATQEAAAREQLETIDQQQAELKRQAAEVAEAHKALAAQQQAWEARQAALLREAEGLERRVRHTRERLDALQPGGNGSHGSLEQAGAAAGPIIPPPMSPALQPPHPPPSQQLQEFSEMLGDQRTHLLSQWRQLFDVQQRWQDERQAILGELERAAEEVTSQEQALEARRQQLEREEAGLLRRQEDFAAHRASLDGWRARLTADEAGWKSQQQNLLDDLASREALLQERRQLLEQVHQRRNARRKLEVAELLALRARCEEARKVYLQRWQEYEHLRAEQDRESRDLAARAAAVEQARDELVHAAPDSARAAGQLERLRKRERARLDAEARSLETERRRLEQDLARAEQDARATRQREEELLSRQLDLGQRIDQWDGQQAVAAEEEARRQQELRRLRARHAVDERHLRELREELERLARLLIEEGNSGPAQAA